MSLLAVDMGSSNCKGIAFAEDGRILAQRSISYTADSARPSWAEMTPEKFWQALVSVSRGISGDVTDDPVEVLAISSHGETLIPVDAHQNPVRPAILNADNRATHEADQLAQDPGRQLLFETTGLAVHAMYPLAKIMWLRKHEAESYATTARFLALTTYLLTRMGLPPYVDYSLACRFLAFDIRKREWSNQILGPCGLSPEQLPIAVRTGTIAGELSAQIAGVLGLRPSTPVVLGGHDQPCAALGCGVLGPGRISASLGTYECLLAASNAPATSNESLSANLNSYCHVVPDCYVTIAYFPSGIMLDWLLHLIYPESRTGLSPEVLTALETQAPQGPTGLCITPHLLGTCNPDFDPAATGIIAGIRPATTQADLYKGILEGIACEFACMAQLLQRAVGECKGIYVSGGGGRSRLGLTLRSSLSNLALHQMRCPEAVCLGTAILAGVATGKYSSFEDAVKQVVHVGETITPDPETARAYASQVEQYRILYSSLAPLRQAQGKRH